MTSSPPQRSITSTIAELCDWLTQAPRSARDTAGRLGAVASESGTALYVKPRDAAFVGGVVSYGDGAAQPTSYVELQLATPGSVTVGDLTQRFGAYREPPGVSGDAPPAIHFTVDGGAQRAFTCLVVAKATSDDESVARGTIRELAVRVDPRL